MTRDSFIAAYKHELAGLILDAATRSKSGPELSLLFGKAMERIETILGRCWDAAQPPEIKPKAATPPVNGATQRPLAQSGPEARRP